jgi:non-specific serine/threonine protein kinase
VASEVVEGFEDGVWLVDLAPLADPSLVPQALASTLGVREQPARLLTETLSDSLGSKKVLVVLDNCEHLIEACAKLSEVLLRSCPQLRVLATSREALGIAGEVARPVPSLTLPDLRRLPDIESLLRYESARLFVERTAAVKPTFALTEQNASSDGLGRRSSGAKLPLHVVLGSSASSLRPRALSRPTAPGTPTGWRYLASFENPVARTGVSTGVPPPPMP